MPVIGYLFKTRKLHILLVFLALWLFSLRLHDGTLRTYDECYYAEQAREILITGDPLTMHHALEKNFENDPVYLWSMAAMFKIFGVCEFAARFPSAIYGALTVLTVFLIGRFLKNYSFGILSGLILATTFEFVRFSRYAHLDVCLSFFVTAAIYNFLRYERLRANGPAGRDRPWKRALLMGIFAGFAVLSKNILGAFALAAIVLYYVLALRPAAIFDARLLAGFFAAAFIPGLWYAYQHFANGAVFFQTHFGYILLKRALDNATEAVPFYQYFKIIATTYIPWLFLLLPGVYYLLRRHLPFLKNPRPKVYIDPLIFYPALFAAVHLAVMSAGQAKKGWYIMPVYPAFALLCSLAVFHLWAPSGRAGREKIMKLVSGVFAFLLFAVFVTTVFPVKVYRSTNDAYKNDFAALAARDPKIAWRRGAVQPVEVGDDYFDYQLPLVFYAGVIPDRSVGASAAREQIAAGSEKYYFVNREKYDKIRDACGVAEDSAEIAASSAEYVMWRVKRPRGASAK